MKLPHDTPDPSGSERAESARDFRRKAAEIAFKRPHAVTLANGEEQDHGPHYGANFTKGLLHGPDGLLVDAQDYRAFVQAINSHDRHLFDTEVPSAEQRYHQTGGVGSPFLGTIPGAGGGTTPPNWRGWESPRAGHVYELEGPDAGSVGMAPAPRVGSSELAAEMAEVYALALLRDVPFTEILAGGDQQLCAGATAPSAALLTSAQIANLLNGMPFFSGLNPRSSSAIAAGLDRFERNRRFARTLAPAALLSPATLFRGSTIGAQTGPYISQFLLIGTQSIAGPGGGASSFPAKASKFDLVDGFVSFGSHSIDQRTIVHKNCLDHMTSWPCWLDVQNGAALGGQNLFEDKRRFITTPRDLATYVHYDALYQAYLNATLILLGMGVKKARGFPEPSPEAKRTAFATFGGPHVLSLVTEVATRCLKAVRRQKFSFHRRGRPEALAGRLALVHAGHGDRFIKNPGKPDECRAAQRAFQGSHDEIPQALRNAIQQHNGAQNAPGMVAMRPVVCPSTVPDQPAGITAQNLLLPMAFAEGSPMHPAYGAGHATVAGGCVTMVKAFFDLFEDCDGRVLKKLEDADGDPIVYVPDATGDKLVKDNVHKTALTIEGELDKLAANIAIGRNMAGVHFYSDYYDSLRMGERIAVGILLEQLPTYGDAVETRFHSFDGDLLTLRGDAGEAATLTILDRDGNPVSSRDWWLRHVPGEDTTIHS